MHAIFLLLVLLLTAPVYSQIINTNTNADSVAPRPVPADLHQRDWLGRGRWQAGLDAAGGWAGYVGFRGLVVPRVQYMLRDGWSVGLEGRVEGRNGAGVNSQTLYTGVGVNSRYYFVRDRRLALFGQVGVTVGLSRFQTAGQADLYGQPTGQAQRVAAGQLTTGLGLHYRLGRRWAVEGVAEQSLTRYAGVYAYGLRGSLGLAFRLGR